MREQGPAPYTFDRIACASRQRIAEGTTIGHQRILSLATPVTATSVRVKVLESRATPHLGATTLHLSTTP
ncbi:hypothetical protein [Streptomyces sp. NPDC056255]|uniref:hypothetical protein n=1 Tax=Streptomyces sp. NPDC056255 TaxID=3345764 RepID=UPI0035D76FF4